MQTSLFTTGQLSYCYSTISGRKKQKCTHVAQQLSAPGWNNPRLWAPGLQPSSNAMLPTAAFPPLLPVFLQPKLLRSLLWISITHTFKQLQHNGTSLRGRKTTRPLASHSRRRQRATRFVFWPLEGSKSKLFFFTPLQKTFDWTIEVFTPL